MLIENRSSKKVNHIDLMLVRTIEYYASKRKVRKEEIIVLKKTVKRTLKPGKSFHQTISLPPIPRDSIPPTILNPRNLGNYYVVRLIAPVAGGNYDVQLETRVVLGTQRDE